MDLKSGYPYWAVKNGLMKPFPRLEADHRCDVAIVGGESARLKRLKITGDTQALAETARTLYGDAP